MEVELPAGESTLRLALPDGDHIGLVMHETGQWYEATMLRDIQERAPIGLAVDVGACVGTHTAWFAAACGMRVLAIEPNPVAAMYLRQNIARNGIQADVLEAAAGNRPGYVEMIGYPGNIGATRARLKPRSAIDGVQMVTIDSLGLDEVGLLKIDVEGFEARVLEGAADTIRRCRPLVYVEAKRGSDAEVERWMQRHGYRQTGKWNKTPTYGYAPVIREGQPLATLSTAIMADPRRERFIPYLDERMGGDVRVVWDEKHDRWDTGRRALLAYDPAASHHLVVQDDALLPRDFIAGVEAAIQTVPDNPVSLYTGRVRPNHIFVEHMVIRAERAGVTWAAFEGPWWGPAVIIPTKYIEDMVAWCDQRTHIPNYDRRMSRYFLDRGLDCFYSVPSLVSHRTGAENPSLVAGRGSGPGRVAFNFIGEDASALSVAWTPEAVWPDRNAPPRTSP